MAVNTSTAVGLSNRVNVYAERQMLKHAMPVLILERFALTKQMPKNKSTTIVFRRPKPFTAATIPLKEGVTPTSTTFAYEDVTGTLKQYGQIGIVTDVIEDTSEDPVLNDLTAMLGENIGRTVEALMWSVARAGTNVFYQNGVSRGEVNEVISLTRQRAITRHLRAQKAQKIRQILDGSPDTKTSPIEAAYVAVGHTDLEADIRNMPGFVPVAQYGTRQTIAPEEIGSVEDVRYILSPDLEPYEDAGGAPGANGVKSTEGAAADVYPIVYFGRDAFGCVRLRGYGAISPTIIPVGQRTKDDPLGQRGVSGWKTWFLALRLNEAWMVRHEVAVSAL